jgi:hypothetical protein
MAESFIAESAPWLRGRQSGERPGVQERRGPVCRALQERSAARTWS